MGESPPRLDCKLIADGMGCEGPASFGDDGVSVVSEFCTADGGGDRRGRRSRRLRVDDRVVGAVGAATEEVEED